MTKAVVCVEDHCSGIPFHVCASGSEDVFVSGRSVCRKGDILTMGETLTQGSNSVFVNGYGIARTGDIFICTSNVGVFTLNATIQLLLNATNQNCKR